jgi:3-methyladenine DNA glycosylase/8-oxoguanine DNA glycosylase
MGVDSRRQRAIRAAASVAARLEECAAMAPAEALARLRVVPGVGEWTAAETAQRALGDPDAVSVGDFHIKDVVVHFLTGRPRGSDAEMVALLQPWAGQRQRVVRLIEMSGVAKPRFGPRFAPVDIRAI